MLTTYIVFLAELGRNPAGLLGHAACQLMPALAESMLDPNFLLFLLCFVASNNFSSVERESA